MYLDGQNEAATAIFDRYVARLLALARRRIGSKLRRRVDAEDIVQSAYRSFFLHAQNNEYQLQQTGDLWRLLASITLHKLYGQVEKHSAAKRGIQREDHTDIGTIEKATPAPSAEEAVAIIEVLHQVIRELSPEERLVLESTLRGEDHHEISKIINKSERTVRRLFTGIRRKLEQRLSHDDSGEEHSRAPLIEYDAPLLYSDYVLEQLLGSGGMGKVYRAREKSSQKKVAIKALHKARQHDQRAVSQFVKEAHILRQLQHTNIVSVEGLGRFPGGGYFMVMNYVEGIDLQALVEKQPFSIPEAVDILTQVTKAVDHAHNNGIIHSDLKPGNVLLDKNGKVLVTDFGFAFLIAGDTSTAGNGIGGTAGYLAPEILRCQSPPKITSDIYSLGVLLWTMVTGTLPESPFSERDAAKELAPVVQIVKRCLADSPAERYQSTQELLADLWSIQQELRE